MKSTSKKISNEYLLELLKEVNSTFKCENVEADSDLFSLGALDSYSIIQLITVLEQQLQIVFNYTDLSAVNFRTLQALTKMLVTKYDCEAETEWREPPGVSR